MAEALEPTEAHLKVLRNRAAGREGIDGFIVQENGVRAFFQCILNGWVSRNELTDEGRAILARHLPAPELVVRDAVPAGADAGSE